MHVYLPVPCHKGGRDQDHLGVQQRHFLSTEHFGNEGAPRAQHMRDDGERGQYELCLHKLIHVMQARHCRSHLAWLSPLACQ